MSIMPNSKNPFECCPFTKSSISNKEQAQYLNSLFKKTETPETLLYTAHIPGLNEDQVNVAVEDERLLKISAEKVVKQEQDGEIKSSRTKIIKTYELPQNAEINQIKSCVKNGVLTVAVSKRIDDVVEETDQNIKAIEIAN